MLERPAMALDKNPLYSRRRVERRERRKKNKRQKEHAIQVDVLEQVGRGRSEKGRRILN